MAENPRIEELRRRVRADPASIAFAALAEEFRRIGRYEDAIETCRMGLQRHPAYLSARVTLGRALIETGEYEAAREELDTVLRSAPENIAALRGIAQINERLGHSTEMDPELVLLANQPIRIAPPHVADSSPLEEPESADVPTPASEPSIGLGTFAIPLAPAAAPEATATNESVDIFAAAPQKSAEPATPVPDAQPETAATPEAPLIPVDLPSMAFEPGTIAFEAPVMSAQPDPHVAATLMRLERLLGAIQTARHA